LPVGKVVELVGTSERGFEDAINEAVRRSAKTLRNVRGIDVVGQKALVKNGKVVEYRVNLKLSFGVE
jgi:dodecin